MPNHYVNIFFYSILELLNITNKNCVVNDYCVKFQPLWQRLRTSTYQEERSILAQGFKVSVHLVFLLWSRVRQKVMAENVC